MLAALAIKLLIGRFSQPLSTFSTLKLLRSQMYKICIIGKNFTLENLGQWNRADASFLKSTLGLHVVSWNRPSYLLLCCHHCYHETYVVAFELLAREALKVNLTSWKQKVTEIDEDLLVSRAMRNNERNGTNQLNRYVVSRVAVHEFQHRLCRRSGFRPNDTRNCSRCGSQVVPPVAFCYYL